MKRIKWIGAGIVVALLSGLGYTGYRQGGDDTALISAATGSQTLSLALGEETPTLDSSLAADDVAFSLLGQINEGLTRLDANGQAEPGVAQRWTVSEDGLTYTFYLREDAKWSDGSQVLANDFEYAWKRTLNPKTNSQYSFMLSWLKNGHDYNVARASAESVGVRAKDPQTLEVVLERPIPFFPEQLALPVFYPQKETFVERQFEAYGTDPDKLLYNGPFKLTEWVHDQSLVLQRNETYWDQANVRLDRVNFQIVNDPATLENLFRSGQLDRIPLVHEQISTYKQSPEFNLHAELTTGYLMFNQQVPVLRNSKVRKALTYAIDGDLYADAVYRNSSIGATGLVPRGTSNGQGGDFRADNGDLIKRQENMPQAKSLLAEGLQELGLSAFPPLQLLSDDSANARKSSEFIVEQWRSKLGLRVEIDTVPFKTRLQRTMLHDYDLAVSLWGADYNDPLSFLDLWISGSELNDTFYSNPLYDGLIQKAREEPDAKQRMSYLYQAEKI
ncbi:MAG: peptide ABC transporter substrate-binding protein, partial [Tumebacillaceae bacterium]